MTTDDSSSASAAVADMSIVLDVDSLAYIFTYLEWDQIFRVRSVCCRWNEAATVTPISMIQISNPKQAKALPSITKTFRGNATGFKIDFGTSTRSETFYVRFGGPEDTFSIDISSIQNLKCLRSLSLRHTSLLLKSEGSNFPPSPNFQHLQYLDMSWNPQLRWSLQHCVEACPNLTSLKCINNFNLRGTLQDLRPLKAQLTRLDLSSCNRIVGSFNEELSDFLKLERLAIDGNTPNISGDITKMSNTDLPSLFQFTIGPGIYGGGNFPSIEEVPAIINAWYQITKRSSTSPCNPCNLSNSIYHGMKRRNWKLSKDSQDYYVSIFCHRTRRPPFYVEFVNIANSRIGWRWTNSTVPGCTDDSECCEIHWFDDQPIPTITTSTIGDNDDIDDGSLTTTTMKVVPCPIYLRALEEDQQKHIKLFKGCFDPPTEVEYKRRLEEIPLDRTTSLRRTRIPTDWAVW